MGQQGKATALEQARSYIQSADLTKVLNRLIHVKQWRRRDALEAISQYRKYLQLCVTYPEQSLPPSKDIDEVWHAHILHTQDYREFCKQILSHTDKKFIDHDPADELPETKTKMESLFETTKALYMKEFGQPIYQIIAETRLDKIRTWLRERLCAWFPKLETALAEY